MWLSCWDVSLPCSPCYAAGLQHLHPFLATVRGYQAGINAAFRCALCCDEVAEGGVCCDTCICLPDLEAALRPTTHVTCLPPLALQVDHTSTPVPAQPAGLGTWRQQAGAGWRHCRPAAAVVVHAAFRAMP